MIERAIDGEWTRARRDPGRGDRAVRRARRPSTPTVGIPSSRSCGPGRATTRRSPASSRGPRTIRWYLERELGALLTLGAAVTVRVVAAGDLARATRPCSARSTRSRGRCGPRSCSCSRRSGWRCRWSASPTTAVPRPSRSSATCSSRTTRCTSRSSAPDFPDAEGPDRPGVQMPAWHQRTENQDGVTIIDIGVGPVEREDRHRPHRGAPARRDAHDRSLRGPAEPPGHRRLRARDLVPARRPHPRPRAAHDDPGDPEPPAQLVPPRRARLARRAVPDRDGADDREPQLGARDQGDGADLRAVARGRGRHGVGDHRRQRLPLPHPERHPARHLRQAAARVAQARGAGQGVLRREPAAPTSRSRSSASTASAASTRRASRTPTSAARASRCSARRPSIRRPEMTEATNTGATRPPTRSRSTRSSRAAAEHAIPRWRIPDDEMLPETAYQIIHDELFLDGNARQNLATFVTTWMEPEAKALYIESFDKNMIDKDEYPQTAAIEERCVHILADLWNAPDPHETIGTSAIGSSEACMLGGPRVQTALADSRAAPRGSRPRRRTSCSARPCRSCGRSSRTTSRSSRATCRSRRRSRTSPPRACSRRVDENTIGVVPILGVTYNGVYEPVKELADALDDLQAAHRARHPDPHRRARRAASSRRSSIPHLEWDFRVPARALDQHVGPQVRARVSRARLGRVGEAGVRARGARSSTSATSAATCRRSRSNFSRPGRAGAAAVLQLPPPRSRGLPARDAGVEGRGALPRGGAGEDGRVRGAHRRLRHAARHVDDRRPANATGTSTTCRPSCASGAGRCPRTRCPPTSRT